jgi:hypothetical protein
VDLVEIPTADETNDNIVAFWSPAELPKPGEPLDIAYRLHWTLNEAPFHSPDSAWVKQTLRSTGDVKQSNLIRQPDGSVAYLVDFEGPSLKALKPDAAVRSQVSVGENGEVVEKQRALQPANQRLAPDPALEDQRPEQVHRNACGAGPGYRQACRQSRLPPETKAEKAAAKAQEKKESTPRTPSA